MINNYKTLRGKNTFFVLCTIVSANVLTAGILGLLVLLGLIQSRFTMTIWVPIAFLITSAILGTIFASFMSKQLIKPLDKLSQATQAVAKGNFNVRIEEETNVQAINTLLNDFNKMASELGSIEMFRSDFINNFSHEFKTPIVSICGFARQLEKGGLTEDEQKKYAHIIAKNAEHLASMSSSVLLMTKLESQEIIEGKEKYSLDDQIRDCILTMQNEWERKNIELTIELDDIDYFGNKEITSHIWSNLIGNAIKFTSENGKITVRMVENNNIVSVSVEDNGIGMSKEVSEHIFDKFYQGDKSHKTPGNGLGLSLTKRIITLCGGDISVQSKEGKGSIFRVDLPNY